jgi:bifunctional hydroxylase/dehydrase
MSRTVTVVGAGPVGLMLASELALAGVETIVLERQPEPTGQSRGMAINAAVVELLTQRGLMDGLRPYGMSWPRAHLAQLWLDPARLSERHENTFLLPQPVLEQRLEEQALKLGVDVRRGHTLIRLEQDADGVTAEVAAATGEYQLRTGYLVGADGTASTVRQLAGIPFPGSELPFHGLVGDLSVQPTDGILQKLGAFMRNGGLYAAAPAGPLVVRISTGEFDRSPADPDAPVTIDELREAVQRLTGEPLAGGEPRWLARWDNATRLADRYRDGRVLLAGDAAHVFFPLGGQALSTGIEDAVNLGWKLAATVLGTAPAGLLDTYESERRPLGARACSTTRAQSALMYPMDRVSPLRDLIDELIQHDAVNEHLVKLVGGLDVRYPVRPDAADPHPLLGRRLAAIPLVTPDGEGTLAELLHRGRGVLLDLTGGATPLDAAGWGDRVDTATARPTAEIDASALLLRPDGYVVWVGADGPAQLTDALRTWFGAAA